MKCLYSLAFLFGADNWKIPQTPIELKDGLKEFDKSNSTVLDLGCEEGRECISVASDGWNVIGVDFVPLAIRRAKASARKARVADKTAFYVGDVTKLLSFDLPPIQFAYDIGCFHLLKHDQAVEYITGLSQVVIRGGMLLLNAFTPRSQGKKMVGYNPQDIVEMFDPEFIVERTSDHSYWRFPARWYWLRRQK